MIKKNENRLYINLNEDKRSIFSNCIKSYKSIEMTFFYFSLFLIIVFFIVSIVFLDNNLIREKSLISIEDEIRTLPSIDDDEEEKMLKIMSLGLKINELSTNEIKYISNIEVLQKEKEDTINSLKNNVLWGEYLSRIDYDVKLYVNTFDNTLNISLSESSNPIINYITNYEFINELFLFIDVPYCLIKDIDILKDTFLNYSNNSFVSYISVNDEKSFLNIELSNGYVLISVLMNNEIKYYISLTRINCDIIKEVCNVNNKNFVINNVLFEDDSIKFNDIDTNLHGPLIMTKELACTIKFYSLKTRFEMKLYDKYKSNELINDLKFLYALKHNLLEGYIFIDALNIDNINSLIINIENKYKDWCIG